MTLTPESRGEADKKKSRDASNFMGGHKKKEGGTNRSSMAWKGKEACRDLSKHQHQFHETSRVWNQTGHQHYRVEWTEERGKKRFKPPDSYMGGRGRIHRRTFPSRAGWKPPSDGPRLREN